MTTFGAVWIGPRWTALRVGISAMRALPSRRVLRTDGAANGVEQA